MPWRPPMQQPFAVDPIESTFHGGRDGPQGATCARMMTNQPRSPRSVLSRRSSGPRRATHLLSFRSTRVAGRICTARHESGVRRSRFAFIAFGGDGGSTRSRRDGRRRATAGVPQPPWVAVSTRNSNEPLQSAANPARASDCGSRSGLLLHDDCGRLGDRLLGANPRRGLTTRHGGWKWQLKKDSPPFGKAVEGASVAHGCPAAVNPLRGSSTSFRPYG